MSAIVLFVELETVPGRREDFLARARAHRQLVLENEPGCERFDISVPEDTENAVRLYEVYADKAAFDLHMETDYMQAYREDTGPMIADRSRTLAVLANG